MYTATREFKGKETQEQRYARQRLEECERAAYAQGVNDGIRQAQPFVSFGIGLFVGAIAGALIALNTNWHAVAVFLHIA